MLFLCHRWGHAWTPIHKLTHIVSHARSRQPLYHVHLDPEQPWTQTQCDRYWFLLEQEFGFESQPFAEAVHIKHGRAHYHRAYSRVRRDGTVIAISHDYARREKLGGLLMVSFLGDIFNIALTLRLIAR